MYNNKGDRHLERLRICSRCLANVPKTYDLHMLTCGTGEKVMTFPSETHYTFKNQEMKNDVTFKIFYILIFNNSNEVAGFAICAIDPFGKISHGESYVGENACTFFIESLLILSDYCITQVTHVLKLYFQQRHLTPRLVQILARIVD